MDKDKIYESLRLHEGLSLRPYVDTVGKTTIGIGRNLDDNGITIQEAYLLCQNDVQTCAKELDRYHPGWTRLDDVRQNVLLEMCFNLGAPRLNQFYKMWEAVERRDFKEAAAQMLDSKWAQQVGQRAITLSAMMKSGEWPE
jgi:lysozyme